MMSNADVIVLKFKTKSPPTSMGQPKLHIQIPYGPEMFYLIRKGYLIIFPDSAVNFQLFQ
jgi:hypothetical protein